MLNGKRVFISGATGMVGNGIICRLLEIFPNIRIVAAYHQMEPWTRDSRVSYFQADLRCSDACRRVVRECDYVIIASAKTANSSLFSNNPGDLINDNLFMNTQLIEASAMAKVKKVIYIGSATLYQDSTCSLTEDELNWQIDPPASYFGFGWVVRFTEKLCSFWHHNSQTHFVSIRASNIYGPYAKFSPRSSNFIPAIIRKVAAQMTPLEIWGGADVVRDVIYVQDFADAVIALLCQATEQYDVYNVSSGIPVMVGKVVDTAIKISDFSQANIIYLNDKPTTAPFRVFDCSKLKNMTGWKPTITLEDGLKRTLNWWEANQTWWTK